MEAQQRGSGVWTLRAVKVVAYFTSCLRNFLLVASFVRSRVPRPSHGIKFNACSQRINNSLIEQSRQSVRVRKLRTELKTLRNFFFQLGELDFPSSSIPLPSPSPSPNYFMRHALRGNMERLGRPVGSREIIRSFCRSIYRFESSEEIRRFWCKGISL